MKFFSLLLASLLLAIPAFAQTPAPAGIAGDWSGTATVHSQQVPIRLRLTGSGQTLKASLINGPDSLPPGSFEQSPASSATFSSNHLLLNFNYYARTLDAILVDGTLTGTFGTATTRYPLTLARDAQNFGTTSPPPSIQGEWEIAVHSTKGESAWQLHVDQDSLHVKAVIQRIDGDTGSLHGSWEQPAPGHSIAQAPSTWRVSHFTAAGPALYSLTPQPDGTLLVSNLLRADATSDTEQNLVARRPGQARQQHLTPPTDPTQQTTIKDPARPFTFAFPDLAGKLVSNTDPQFRGKVVIVAVGGSWCPNCHDEAPFLQSLYQQFHTRGLEIVDLSFEEADQLKDPTRLRAFIARYHLTYTVLVAGEPDQLNQKISQADHLNSWPTSFLLARDGRVREVHSGFAGPANPTAHEALERNTTALIEDLLREPAPAHDAKR